MTKLLGALSVLALAGAGCLFSPSPATTEVETGTQAGIEIMEEDAAQDRMEEDEVEEDRMKAEAESRTVVLKEQNDSGQSGTAVLVEKDGQTTVTLSLTGAPSGVEQPAHIHVGSCATIGGVQFPLIGSVDGYSTTVLDMTLADILISSTQLSINVHKSVPEVATYVACGDLQL